MKKTPVIILAIADYRTDDAQHLRELGQELDGIKAALAPAEAAGLCHVVDFADADVEKIVAAFDKYEGAVVGFHFSGHADGFQLMLDGNANGAELAAFLGRQRSLRFAFLNGCSTLGHVEAMHQNGVSAVIATARAIDDHVASELAISFYEQLAVGKNLETAFLRYETEQRIRKTPPESLYRLRDTAGTVGETANGAFPWQVYYKPGAEAVRAWDLPTEANNPLFGLPPIPPTYDLPATPFRYLHWYGRADAEVFFGRGREIRELYQDLSNPELPPIVLLNGQSGVGKSSLLEAGLLPRLEAGFQVAYLRRDAAAGLWPTLTRHFQLAEVDGDALLAAWREKEKTEGKPLVVLLDQVEEAITRALSPGELLDFLERLRPIFLLKNKRPQGKIVLSFRKEYLADIIKGVQQLALPVKNILIERLDRAGIVDVVNGLGSSERLRAQYDASIDPELAEAVAGRLHSDPVSPVAPMLQILMSRLWEEGSREQDGQPRLSIVDFQDLEHRGLGLDAFLQQQMAQLTPQEMVESGLALDVLYYHTSPLGASQSRPLTDTLRRYNHIPPDGLQGLLDRLTDAYLLVALPAHDEKPPRYALAHDTLAPVIRQQYEASAAPGQSAARLLDSLAQPTAISTGQKTDTALNAAQVRVIEAGQTGMRALAPAETELLTVSRNLLQTRERNRRAARIGLIAAGGIAFLGMALAFFAERRRSGQLSATATLYQARLLEPTDPTRAYHLLRESTKRHPTDESLDEWHRIYRENLLAEDIGQIRDGVTRAAAIAPGGSHMVAVVQNGAAYRLRLYELSQPDAPKQLAAPGSDLPYLQFSADGRRILGGGFDHRVHFPSIDGLVPTIGHDSLGLISAVALAPNGVQAAVAYEATPWLHHWDLGMGRVVQRMAAPGQAVALAWLDDTHLLAGQRDGRVLTCATATGRSEVVAQRTANVAFISCSPSGRYAAIGWRDSVAVLYAVEKGRLRPLRNLPVHQSAAVQATFSPDETMLLLAGENGGAALLSVPSGALLHTLRAPGFTLLAAAFATDQRAIFTVSTDGRWRKWALPPAVPTVMLPTAIAASLPDTSLLVWAKDQTIFWADRQSVHFYDSLVLPWPVALMEGLSGRRVLVGGTQGQLALADLSNHQSAALPPRHSLRIEQLATDPSGHRALSVDQEGNAGLWDLTNLSLMSLSIPSDVALAASFSADGRYLAIAGLKNGLQTCQLDGGVWKTLAPPERNIVAAVYGGGRLYGASGSGTIFHWPMDGKGIDSLRHVRGITALAFDAQRNVLLSGDEAGRVSHWDMRSGRAFYQSPAQPGNWNSSRLRLAAHGRFSFFTDETAKAFLWDNAAQVPRR